MAEFSNIGIKGLTSNIGGIQFQGNVVGTDNTPDGNQSGVWDLSEVYDAVRKDIWTGGGGGGGSETIGPAPTFRAVNSDFQGLSNSITVTKPTGTIANDVILAFHAVYDDVNAISSPPDGSWTQISRVSRDNGSEDAVLTTYYKVAGGSEPANYTFTHDGALNYQVLSLMSYYDANTTSPISANTTNSGTNANVLGSSIVTSNANNTLVFCGIGYNGAPTTTPSGMTERDIWDTVCGVWDQKLTANGATGDKFYIQSVSSTWTTSMVTLRPVITPGSTPSPPTFQSVTDGGGATTTNFVMNKPTGTTEGDLLIASVGAYDYATTITASGWTVANSVTWPGGGSPNYALTHYVFYKIAGASEPATYTFTNGVGSIYMDGAILRYSGHDPTTPIGDSTTEANDNSDRTAPSVTTTIANSTIVLMTQGYLYGGNGTPTGMTERVNYDAPYCYAFDEVITSAGATGSRGHSSTNSDCVSAIMIVINPST